MGTNDGRTARLRPFGRDRDPSRKVAVLDIVTGGAGFLGSHLVDALAREGAEVVVLDDFSTGRAENLDAALATGRVRVLRLDVARPLDALREPVEAALGGRAVDRIFHLASPASPDAYGAHPWETLAVNAVGTMAMIDLAVERGARFVFASTSEIYGDPLVHPQPESYFGNVDPIGPRACYDEGKRFGEAAVSVAVRARGLDGRIVRFFNCYGPRMSPRDGRLVAELAAAAAAGRPLRIDGSGLQTRCMTYVDDAVAMLLRVVAMPPSALAPVNIGNDHERSVLDIARVFAEVAGVPFVVEHGAARSGDPQRRRPDLTRARALGETPRTSLHDGLRRTLASLRDGTTALA